MLGRGGFGTVYLVRDENELRVVKKVGLKEKFTMEQVREEGVKYEQLKRLRYPFMVDLVRTWEENEMFHLAMVYDPEYVPLHKFDLEGHDVLALCSALRMALQWLHFLGWCHGDVKPENILVRAPRDGGHWSVKFIDWATASCRDNEEQIFGPTPIYMAPEETRRRWRLPRTIRQRQKADIWALGCVLYEICNPERYTPIEQIESVLKVREVSPKTFQSEFQMGYGLSKDTDQVVLSVCPDLRHMLSLDPERRHWFDPLGGVRENDRRSVSGT